MITPYHSTYNQSRRRPDQPMRVCPMCRRQFIPRWNQHLVHCSQACAGLAKQRGKALDNGR